MQRTAKRLAARKNHQSPSTRRTFLEKFSVVLPQGSADITDTSSTSPGAVAVQEIAPSLKGSIDGSNDNDSFDVGSGTVHHSRSDQEAPAPLILAAQLVQDEPSVPDFIEEHLERRIREIEERVESQLRRAQPQFYPRPSTATTATVVAEDVAPTGFAGLDGLPYNKDGTSPTGTVCGLRRRTMLMIGSLVFVLAVMVVILGVIVAAPDPSSPSGQVPSPSIAPPSPSPSVATTAQVLSSSPSVAATVQDLTHSPSVAPTLASPTFPPTASAAPTSLLQNFLDARIVRNDADRALLKDPTTPQYRAFDWLSAENFLSSTTLQPKEVLERYVLAVLYYSTDGPTWSQKQDIDFGFLSGDHVCSWNNNILPGDGNQRGVFCGDGSNVTSLSLELIGLSGTIPWELSLLSDMSICFSGAMACLGLYQLSYRY